MGVVSRSIHNGSGLGVASDGVRQLPERNVRLTRLVATSTRIHIHNSCAIESASDLANASVKWQCAATSRKSRHSCCCCFLFIFVSHSRLALYIAVVFLLFIFFFSFCLVLFHSM